LDRSHGAGTVLSSYWNAGAVPDPSYGDNQLAISDSFFYADFWYRTEFKAPRLPADHRAWLNFDGINWKAEAWLNGEKLAGSKGRSPAGDLTSRARPPGREKRTRGAHREERHSRQREAEDIRVRGPERRRAGRRQPTYHASIGWTGSHGARPQHRHME